MDFNYVRGVAAELRNPKDGVELADAMCALANKQNRIRRNSCVSLCAPMVGVLTNVAILNTGGTNWLKVANLAITKRQGDPAKWDLNLINFPGKFWQVETYPSCDVYFDNLNTGEQVDETVTNKNLATTWQALAHILGGEELTLVYRNYQTLGSEPKQKPNDRCDCESGKKFKKCCGRRV